MSTLTTTPQQSMRRVLDLVMPGVDGFEFLDRLRRLPAGQTIPVIVWTVKDLTLETWTLAPARR